MSVARRRPAVSPVLLSRIFALVAAACGSPAMPALTDPTEIVTAGLRSAESAKSVHVELTVDGTIKVDLTGSGGSGTSLPLAGTMASADVDMANGKAHATFAIPAFLNLSGELIQVGETSYVKSSLTGPLFEAQDATDSLPVDPTDTSSLVDGVSDFLAADGVDPVKGDDVDCGGKSCYSVAIELTAAELAALGADPVAAEDLPIDMADANVALTIRVEKDTHRLAGVTTVASLGAQGTVTVILTLSKWDEPVSIAPPPADQVAPAS